MIKKNLKEISLDEIHPDQYKTLFILGNGFDLMHHVKSKYTDFYSFLLGIREKHPMDHDLEELLFIMDHYIKAADPWSNVEEALAKFDFEREMNIFDFEAKVYEWYRHAQESEDLREESQIEKYAACYSLLLSEGTRAIITYLERYLRIWAKSLTIDPKEKTLKNLFLNGNSSKILCFNYTDFIESQYHIGHDQVCYIHGWCNASKGDPSEKLIIGFKFDEDHKDDAWLKALQNSVEGMEGCKKKFADTLMRFLIDHANNYVRSMSKNCEEIMDNHSEFFNSLKGIEQIVVIGHSLNDIDMGYFDRINSITKTTCKKWAFTGHSESGKKRIKKFTQDHEIHNYYVLKIDNQ